MRDITDIKNYEKEILKQKELSEQLLHCMLPKSISNTLKSENILNADNRPLVAECYEETTITFIDIAGFTAFSSKIKPDELIVFLNTIFSVWDKLCAKHRVEKIKTIGGQLISYDSIF